MARVTIEDCLEHIPNRFELVMVAVTRARKLEMGAVEALVDWKGDKPTVVALREIAEGKVGSLLALDTAASRSKAQNETLSDKEEAGEAGETV